VPDDEQGDADGDADPERRPMTARRAPSMSTGRISDVIANFIHVVELVAAAVFALLFAIGVADLILQIVQATLTGRITDPRVVIGFIDTGLLLLIIVEVYETVVAYTEESDTRRIVRLVIYTGVIAMVRKVIIFRTGEYGSPEAGLFASVAYTLLLLGLAAILLVERMYGDRLRSS
jgi:uncharacterized membrane protein (DUF373 family)